MDESRKRVRKPDPEEAAVEGIVTEEPVKEETTEVVMEPDTEVVTETITEEPVVESTPVFTGLNLPVSQVGHRIMDAKGRIIAACGAPGRMADTGPDLAGALVALINR